MDIFLRAPKLEDINCYHAVFSDKWTHHFIIDEGRQNFKGSMNKLEALIAFNGTSKKTSTIVFDGEAVGFIVIHLDDSDCPFVSYAIQRESQKKGLASLALAEFIRIESGNFKGIKAATHLDNEPSQKLLLKTGFERLGVRQLEAGERVLFERAL